MPRTKSWAVVPYFEQKHCRRLYRERELYHEPGLHELKKLLRHNVPTDSHVRMELHGSTLPCWYAIAGFADFDHRWSTEITGLAARYLIACKFPAYNIGYRSVPRDRNSEMIVRQGDIVYTDGSRYIEGVDLELIEQLKYDVYFAPSLLDYLLDYM